MKDFFHILLFFVFMAAIKDQSEGGAVVAIISGTIVLWWVLRGLSRHDNNQ